MPQKSALVLWHNPGMDNHNSGLEPDDLWSRLLSRQPELIHASFDSLSVEEKDEVRSHLQRMSEEPGWHLEQRISAQAALKAIDDRSAGA